MIRSRRYTLAAALGTSIVTFLAVQAGNLSAQPPTTDAPTPTGLKFSVASFKPSDPKSTQSSFWRTSPNGDVSAHHNPMLAYLVTAFGMRLEQIVGYPRWVEIESFDLDAKSGDASEGLSATPNRASYTRFQARMEALLIERCQLVTSRTTRKQLGWVLTTDRKGPRLPPATADPGPIRLHPFELNAESISTKELAEALSNYLHGSVDDQTGLSGKYKIDLKWSPPPQAPGSTSSQPVSDLPEIPGAVRQQLGLVLTSRKIDVEVLVVEKIQRPSAN